MNRMLIPLFLFFFSGISLFAQNSPKASEQKESFHSKMKGNAIVITLEGQKKNVEKVIESSFPGNKITKEKGGLSGIMQQSIKGMYKRPLDLYWRVEKADEEQSRIVMFLANGFDNFLSSQKSKKDIESVSTFLEGLQLEVRKYELNLVIEAQQKVIGQAEKQQEKLERENEKLLKNKAKLEEQLEQNKKDTEENLLNQENQKETIASEKQLLEELKLRLESLQAE